MKVSPDGRQSYTAAEQLEKFKNRPGSMPFPVEQAAREESKSFAKRTFESGIAVDIGQIGASERGFYFGFKAGHASRDEEVKALQDEVDDWRESARKAADETCGPWLSNIGEAAGRRPRVLIACERSGIVRDAFRAAGCDAFSCDTEAAESPSPYHVRGDVRPVLRAGGWDLVIAHPPCTYLASSGLHWNRRRPERAALTEAALEFVRELMATCEQIGARYAIENPIGCISTRIRKPDQIVQPWQFGDDASKATCLWLSGLPQLQPTNVLPGGRLARRANQTASGQNRLGPSPERAYLRAKTYPGIAEAMARQWALVIAHKYPRAIPSSERTRPTSSVCPEVAEALVRANVAEIRFESEVA